MHADRIESLPPDTITDYERAAMLLLLTDLHPWTRAELARELAGTKGIFGDALGAIENLFGAGLVQVCGELVIPSRSMRRMEELSPICI